MYKVSLIQKKQEAATIREIQDGHLHSPRIGKRRLVAADSVNPSLVAGGAGRAAL